MSTPLQLLAQQGTSPWLDYISREIIQNGELAGLVDGGVAGLTSNPTIFQAAISEGTTYDDQLREILQSETDPKEVFLAIAREDIRAACDLLAPVYDRGDETRDGWVSLEVDPRFAHDAEKTGAEAKRLTR